MSVSWYIRGSDPAPKADPVLIKVAQGDGLSAVLTKLEDKRAINSAAAVGLMVRFKGLKPKLTPGTYRVIPGSEIPTIFTQLQTPFQIAVRVPEGWWIRRVAERLESQGFCKAEDYIALANDPARFQKQVKFKLPAKTLEGYLFPDTYHLDPDDGAEQLIAKQLASFGKRVIPLVNEPNKVHRALVIGSMVEAEVAKSHERSKVAGIIENRLRIRMPLQIDATVLYALQKWQVLGPGVVNKVDSPYNTYRIPGLPPGPIGSPGLASIEAALKPATTDKLYYVALPDQSHLFARTYAEHLANIRKARAATRG